ncbi:MAG: GDSL family lipase, partial [Opitutia bacterium]
MKLIPTSLVLVALATTALNAVRGADSFQPAPGFVSLFNGKDLSGWCYRDGAKTDEKIADAFDGKAAATDGRFSAKDGVLIVHPKTPRLAQKIWTTKEFPKDFVLRLEFRAAAGADSGIFIRKPQLQCRDYLVAG